MSFVTGLVQSFMVGVVIFILLYYIHNWFLEPGVRKYKGLPPLESTLQTPVIPPTGPPPAPRKEQIAPEPTRVSDNRIKTGIDRMIEDMKKNKP